MATALSHPSWVRGLKFALRRLIFFTARVAPLVGAWIEILLDAMQTLMNQSHPSWVRGLKSQFIHNKAHVIHVAPLVGAWIEIALPRAPAWSKNVAPLVGAWIEMSIPVSMFS